jgi:hypothetical protein
VSIAQHYFAVVERAPQEVIPEGLFRVGRRFYPESPLSRRLWPFLDKYSKIDLIKVTAIWVQFVLGSIGITPFHL